MMILMTSQVGVSYEIEYSLIFFMEELEISIMKLTDLLKEQPSPDENNLIDILKDVLGTVGVNE